MGGMIRTLAFLDCLVAATTAVTVGGGGGDDRLQERTKLVSGSLVWKTSWEEEEITAAVTVDTTREDTTREDTIRDTTREDTIKDTTREDTIRTDVSVTTS